MKKNFRIAIRNELQTGNVLELSFLDDVYDYIDWEEWRVVKVLEDIVAKVRETKPTVIKCLMNSYGGDTVLGLAIYSFLKAYDATIEVDVIGIAASIASVIAMAASPGKLRIAKNGFMVIHQAWTPGGVYGTAEDIRKFADVLDKHTGTVVSVYAERTGKTEAVIAALMPSGTDYWMTGSEAVDQGFADGLIEENRFSSMNSCIRNMEALGFTGIPEDVLKNVHEDSNPTYLNSILMDFKKLFGDFAAKFKGTTIPEPKEGDSANLAELVCNAMSGPMEAMVTGMQTEVTAELDTRATTIANSVKTDIKADLDKIGELETKINDLVKTVNDLKGGETIDPPPGPTSQAKFGSFVKA